MRNITVIGNSKMLMEEDLLIVNIVHPKHMQKRSIVETTEEIGSGGYESMIIKYFKLENILVINHLNFKQQIQWD